MKTPANCKQTLTCPEGQGRSVILEAVDLLNDRLVAADSIGQSLDLAGGQNAPVWVHLFNTQVEAIRQASESLETLLRGYGGYAPHGDAALDQDGFFPRRADTQATAKPSSVP